MNTAPTTQELENIWLDLEGNVSLVAPGRRTRRVMPQVPHDCFLAVEFPLVRRVSSIAIDSAERFPGTRALTSGILVAASSTPVTHQPAVDLVLRDPLHADIFTALSADLLGTLAGAMTDAPADTVLRRLDEWRGLLAGVQPEGLSHDQQRGLVGELTVLADILLPAAGPAAVSAWTGPTLQVQDFQFGPAAVEVKTVSATNADLVRITNERQLDHRGPGRLFLVTVALDARQGGTGATLPELVTRVRRHPRLHGAVHELDRLLQQAGYLDTQAHLYLTRYRIRHTLVHEVLDGFPRLVESDLPRGVSDVSYKISLAAASAFVTDRAVLAQALTGITGA